MKYLLYILFVLFSTISVSAQLSIQGTITDKKTGEALPGVNIYLPELQKGTISDKNGKYILKNLPKGRFKIQYSFIGYNTQSKTIEVKGGLIKQNIQLDQEAILSQEVVVTAGSYTSQHENAIKIESLNAKALEFANSPSLIESIAQLPGVDLISKGVGVSTPVIRGLSRSNVLVLNDGIRMENFQFSEDHPFMVDESGLQNVEIIKGPASLLYGSDAIGGVINLISEQAAPANTFMVDFNNHYYENTKGFNSDIGLKSTHNDIFWIFRSSIKSHMDYTDGANQIVPNSRFNTQSIKFNTGLNKSFGKFSIIYNYNKMKLGMTVPPALSLYSGNKRENEFWFQDLSNHMIISKNILFINNLKFDVNLSYQSNVRKLQGNSNQPQDILVKMHLNTFSYELKSHLYSTDKSNFTVGIQGLNQHNQRYFTSEFVLPNYTLFNLSLYGLYQLEADQHFNLQAGARFDYRNVNIPEQYKDIIETQRLESIDNKYGNLSGSIGGTYTSNQHLFLRANLATAYRNPNIAEISQDGMHGNRYEQGDKNLKSQRSYQGDFSVHYHANQLSFDLSPFYNLIKDYIYLAPTNDTSIQGTQIYRYKQNNSKIIGFETSLNYRPAHWFDAHVNYGYLIGKQENGDNLPFIPQNKINAGIKFSKSAFGSFHSLFFSGNGIYAFDQNNPAAFETETNHYFVLNTSAGVDLKTGKLLWSMSLFATNLLNASYYDHLSTLKSLGYRNMGRNVGIKLSIKY